MSEPEELLIQAAVRATSVARELWRRHSPEAERLTLHESRTRIELLLGALYGEPPPVRAAEPPAVPGWLGRLLRRIPAHLVEHSALASTDGVAIRLPPWIEVSAGRERDIKRYQLLAIEQAARVVRGSARFQPDEGDRLARELFGLGEAIAIERELAATLPGLVPALEQARSEALLRRPPEGSLGPAEQAVEALLCDVLRAPPCAPPAWAGFVGGPQASRDWAREHARRIAACGAFRGVPRVALWGWFEAAAEPRAVGVSGVVEDPHARHTQPRVGQMRRRPRMRESEDDEDDERPGAFIVKAADAEQSVEDPLGLQRPADRAVDLDADELGDSLSELAEARVVRTPERAREVLLGNDPPGRAARTVVAASPALGIVYPEWDYRRGCYRKHGAVVREMPPALGGEAWAEGALKRHASLVRDVRRRFERLRPRRLRLGRQTDGDDIDLDAFITAYADHVAGSADDDRLYESVRPRRRDLAVCLLVDVSASTDSWVVSRLRVVDVEKEALLVVCEALEALGDPYAVLAFSGEGPEAVTIANVKRFDEPLGRDVHQRIAGLEPERYTRVGAAVRHATAVLTERTARHQVLLLLSDGKPNDVDEYESRYGVEDTRQAVFEARRQGITVLCLTVDRQAPVYVPRIFGPGAYSVLPRPELLPRVLVDVMRRLLVR